MKKHSIVNYKCPCFLFRYPNLDIPSHALFKLHRANALHLNAVVKTTNIFKALQATQGNPSHGPVNLSSQFSTVSSEIIDSSDSSEQNTFVTKQLFPPKTFVNNKLFSPEIFSHFFSSHIKILTNKVKCEESQELNI